MRTRQRPAISCRICRKVVEPGELGEACPMVVARHYDFDLAGSPHRFGDYPVGEKIDHVDGITVEEAEHQMATRLYQNTARVHFNQFPQSKDRFSRRLIYGGHVISLARALSFNGLANAFHITAINAGRHVAPLFAGCTVFAWSEVLDKADLPGRSDVGALRLRTIATKDQPCARVSAQAGCGRSSGGHSRFGLLGVDAEVVRPPPAAPRACDPRADAHRARAPCSPARRSKDRAAPRGR